MSSHARTYKSVEENVKLHILFSDVWDEQTTHLCAHIVWQFQLLKTSACSTSYTRNLWELRICDPPHLPFSDNNVSLLRRMVATKMQVHVRDTTNKFIYITLQIMRINRTWPFPPAGLVVRRAVRAGVAGNRVFIRFLYFSKLFPFLGRCCSSWTQ